MEVVPIFDMSVRLYVIRFIHRHPHLSVTVFFLGICYDNHIIRVLLSWHIVMYLPAIWRWGPWERREIYWAQVLKFCTLLAFAECVIFIT